MFFLFEVRNIHWPKIYTCEKGEDAEERSDSGHLVERGVSSQYFFCFAQISQTNASLSALFTLHLFMLGNTGILKTVAGKIIPSLLSLDDEGSPSGSTVEFIYRIKLSY